MGFAQSLLRSCWPRMLAHRGATWLPPLPTTYLNVLAITGVKIFGSPQEFVTSGILRGFPGFLKSDVFGVGHGYAPCFQQEVT
ncbi:MAG: hypothetical protein ABSB35_41980, partial [Bryobacteraceae bacterium]